MIWLRVLAPVAERFATMWKSCRLHISTSRRHQPFIGFAVSICEASNAYRMEFDNDMYLA